MWKMEKQVSFDLAVGNTSKNKAKSSNSDVLDTMKSRYPCIYQPINPSYATLEEEEDVDAHGDRRYLTPLWVFGTRVIDDLVESPLPPSFSNTTREPNIKDPHILKERITSALTNIRFRENGVLVQFWSPVEVRNRWLLTTWDQPFGIGVADEGLYAYRLKSELRAIVVDGEDREELGPPGRVYRQKLPEWSLNVHAGNNMYGYIDLPVFESSGDSCVGVLEIITSSNYVDYAFEVQEVSKALKKQNLRSPNNFEDSRFCAADERRRHEHEEILKVLKAVCDIHNLPLAQTWALSGHTSFVAKFGHLEQTCSSFNKSCIGRACMSTEDLPFYVRDLSMCDFHIACRETHLGKSQGVVGTSFSSCGTRFFGDVTELDEDDYPLVPFARMSGITSCVAIYITSYDDEYVIEFFLPTCNANEAELLKLTKTVREQLKNTSCVQLDIMMAPKPLFTEKEEDNIENESSNSVSVGPSQSVFPFSEKGISDFDTNPTGETRMKGKRSKNSISLEEIEKPFGKTIDEAAAAILNEVPRMSESSEWMSETSEYESCNSGAVGTSHGVVPYWKKRTTQRRRKRSKRMITLEQIQNHTGKPIDDATAILNGFEGGSKNIVPHRQTVVEKIRAALKLLAFRDKHVLVQFWWPRDVGKHKLLTIVDQPFGVGVADERLCSYRRHSERNAIFVDKDDEEEDISPPARVFRRGLPEWTSDLTNYRPEDFPQQECAIRCNLHGYVALPVFDSNTCLCVGVLELLTSSKYMSFAFEVQQVYKALKTQNLTSPQVFGTPKIPYESRQNELDKVYGILKTVCDMHNLPLAQTWAVSPSSSFVSRNKVIEKSCDSFDIKCVGKVCMSTAALPFYVKDLSVWSFREACINQHLDKYHGFVGRALLARGSSYCQDVTKLSEEEYPLVHNAHMSGLMSCFTVFMHSVEGDVDYVLEFFLQLDSKDSGHVLDLVQTLKQNVEVASGFVLGDISPREFVGSPRSIQRSSITTANTLAFGMDSSNPETFLANAVKTDTANVPTHSSSKENPPDKQCNILTNSEVLAWNDVRRESINVVGSNKNDNATSTIVIKQKTSDTITDAEEKSSGLKRGRKRKIDLIRMEAVEKHVGKPIGQAAESVGVSRSTLKRFCRENGIPSWPMPKQRKETSYVTDPKLSPESGSKQRLPRSSSPCFDFGLVVLVVIKLKRWSCSSKHQDFSGKWWRCGKHKYLPSISNTVYQVVPQKTVKATFKGDTIKFRVPISSGLLELENEVAQRLGLRGKRLNLKYKDDHNGLLQLTCEDALHTHPEFLASDTTIKLLVELACV